MTLSGFNENIMTLSLLCVETNLLIENIIALLQLCDQNFWVTLIT